MKFFTSFFFVEFIFMSGFGSLSAQIPFSTSIFASAENFTSADKLVEQAKNKFLQKDFTGAMADLNQAIKLSPKYAKAYNGRGLLKMSQKDFEGSMTDFNMAISLSPRYAKPYINRGSLKLKKGNLNGALDDLNLAIKFDPNLADSYNNRGLIFLKLGKKEIALKDFQRAIELYEAQGDKESAKSLREAVQKINKEKV